MKTTFLGISRRVVCATRAVFLAGTAVLSIVTGPVAIAQQSAPPPALAPQPEGPSGVVAKRAVLASRHMAAAANPVAAAAGREILRQGGSALDAAIAIQLVLNLVEPQSSGIGGGAFLVHYDATTRRITTYDGRETAPARIGPSWVIGADGLGPSSVIAMLSSATG